MPPLRGVIHSAGCAGRWSVAATELGSVRDRLCTKSHRQPAVAPADGIRRARFLCLVLVCRSGVRLAGPGQSRSGERVHGYFSCRARRVPAMQGLSINWGAWEGAGAAVDRGVTARAREAGYGVIDPQGGFQRLEAALNGGRSQVIVFPADWPRFLRHISRDGHFPPFLTNFTGPGLAARSRTGDRGDGGAEHRRFNSGSSASQIAPSFADRLAAVAPNQRRAVVIDQIRRDTARVLGLENLRVAAQ